MLANLDTCFGKTACIKVQTYLAKGVPTINQAAKHQRRKWERDNETVLAAEYCRAVEPQHQFTG